MKLVILQPGYLPWLGFFDQMAQSDIFMFYDDVQYDKHGWRNRNRIKTSQGPQWLTVPVLTKNKKLPLIKDVKIDNNTPWRYNHLQSIKQNYSRTPYFELLFPDLDKIYLQQWEYIIDLDTKLIDLILKILGLNKRIEFSSHLLIKGTQTERLINFCKFFKADEYLTGAAAKDYLEEERFKEESIHLEYQKYNHPIYPQLYGDFIPYLSIIDLLFNEGPESLKILTGDKYA
jgi:hypothetical protein